MMGTIYKTVCLRRGAQARSHVLLLAVCTLVDHPRPTPAAAPNFTLQEPDLSAYPAFLIYGDTRFTKWQFAGTATSPWARTALVRKIAAEHPEALFISGDLPLRGAEFRDYQVFENETAPWRSAHLRVFPVLGNHEFYERDFYPSQRRGLKNWWRVFPYLNDMRWYSVQIGLQIYVLCLDSNFGALRNHTPQRTWIAEQLSGLPASTRYVFCVLHHARISDYMEDHASLEDLEHDRDLDAYLEQEQQRLRARIIVVSGHVHNYGRFERNGVIYLISGGGGAHPVFFKRRKDDKFGGKDLTSAGKPLPNYHYLRFEHAPDALSVTVVRISNPLAGAGEATWDIPDRFKIRSPEP